MSANLKAKAERSFGADGAGSLGDSLVMNCEIDEDADKDIEIDEPSGPFEAKAGWRRQENGDLAEGTVVKPRMHEALTLMSCLKQ